MVYFVVLCLVKPDSANTATSNENHFCCELPALPRQRVKKV